MLLEKQLLAEDNSNRVFITNGDEKILREFLNQINLQSSQIEFRHF